MHRQIEQGETASAFRFLCVYLSAYRFPLTAPHLKQIERIGKDYGVEPTTWAKLKALLQNDGRSDVRYDFGTEKAQNERLNELLNEVCHVFHCHPDGTWQSTDQDTYARMLLPEIRNRPSLIRRLLNSQDRVVKMVVFRAIELRQLETGEKFLEEG